MTQESRFWTGTLTGDAGPYSFEDMNEVFRYFVGDPTNKSGVFYKSGTAGAAGLVVTESSPAAASVLVSVGAALVHGSFYKSTANETLAIAANTSGNARIDSVVLTKLWATQTVRLEVLQGTPAGSPVAPTLTQTDGFKWQFRLANIAVADSFVTIVNANISAQADDSLGAIATPTTLPLVMDHKFAAGPWAANPGVMQDINATFVITLNLVNTRVKFSFSCYYTLTTPASSHFFYNVYSDGLAAYFGGTESLIASTDDYGVQTFVGIFTGLTPGSNTFRLRHKTTPTYAGSTIVASFIVEEISD